MTFSHLAINQKLKIKTTSFGIGNSVNSPKASKQKIKKGMAEKFLTLADFAGTQKISVDLDNFSDLQSR